VAVGVTHFFRDPEVCEALAAQVLPAIVERGEPGAAVRIWVPGCASGEEAYSLAILVREHLAQVDAARSVQIFATDIDSEILAAARLGRYSDQIREHVSSERLERFFVRDEDCYQVSHELRAMCTFSEHSLIRDPPFSSLDLISCRNVLIHFSIDPQKKLVPLFHYALRPGGFLLLGPSESVAAHSELFATVDKEHRLFQRNEGVVKELQSANDALQSKVLERRTITVSSKLLLMGGEDGSERVLESNRDVTERIAAEAEHERLIEALREADRRKDEFLAMLSHELRNPLAPIRNSLFILERAPFGGEQARRAEEVIKRQVAQLTRIVDDLLDVTRVSRGKLQVKRQHLELGELVRRTVEDHRMIIADAGLELEVRTGERALWVDGDPARLAQAIGNLLSNAAKFTSRGGHVLVALEEAAAPSGMAFLRVRDDGDGINPELLPRLFEPFEQADRTLDRSRGGLGLGLTLVKGLVEQHGGQVHAASEGPGKGAEFTIQLPLVQAPPTVRPATAGGLPRSTRRILVIEDNLDAANSLREALTLAQHEVEVAYRGPDGLDRAREFKPDVVLCDIGLPGMDGYQVARAIRADSELRSVHLIALTGYALPQDLAKAKEAGFDQHVAKPPSMEKLEEVLENSSTRW
jgi:chemotaxis methyl-accepting protein methylase/CheY-like chemotaxis protein